MPHPGPHRRNTGPRHSSAAAKAVLLRAVALPFRLYVRSCAYFLDSRHAHAPRTARAHVWLLRSFTAFQNFSSEPTLGGYTRRDTLSCKHARTQTSHSHTYTLSVSLRHVTALSTPSTRTQVTTETTVSLNQGERITVHAGCSETHNAVCSTYASRASIALAFAVHTAPPAGRPALDGRCTLLYRTSQTHRHGAQPQLEMRSPLRFMCVCSRRLPLTQRRRPHSASRRLPPARSAHRLRIVFVRCLGTKRARPH